MRLLCLLRKGYRQLNADIEGFFQGFSSNGAFCIMCLLVILVLLTGCTVFLSVEESGGFGPMAPLLASLFLAFFIIRRYYKAEVRQAKEERIQRGLREAPETWSRFSANTPPHPRRHHRLRPVQPRHRLQMPHPLAVCVERTQLAEGETGTGGLGTS